MLIMRWWRSIAMATDLFPQVGYMVIVLESKGEADWWLVLRDMANFVIFVIFKWIF